MVKLETRDRIVTVTLRCDSFGSGTRVAIRNWDCPPDGYRLNGFSVRKRNHSGQRCVLSLEFLHIDRRVAPLTKVEADTVFELDAQVAAGMAEYPPEKED